MPSWSADTVTAVDLDLDVLRGWTGRVWVEDEDELADHRVRFGYSDNLVCRAVSSCQAVRDAVQAEAAPYDDKTAQRWLAILAQRVGA